MDMFDEARAMAGTLELCKITQEELGKRLGVGQSCVANKLRLLNFSDRMIEKIRESGISERHARALLRLDDEQDREDALRRLTEGRMTVRQCEAMVDAMIDSRAPSTILRADRVQRISVFRQTLTRSLATLTSLGVDAKEYTSYLGGKIYITLCISEE